MKIKSLLVATVAVHLIMGSSTFTKAQCLAPSSWFPHSQTPQPDDNANFNTNCKFHQWSWQMFLWLTQPTGPNGELRFEMMPTAAELFALGDAKPVAFAARKAPSVLKLAARVTKSGDPSSLNEINQAGSRGLLIAHNNDGDPKKGGRAVYFSQHINDTFYNFVLSNQYYIPAKYAAAQATQDFPIGSLELKAAWRIVPKGESSGLYVRLAQINKLKTGEEDQVVVDTTQTEMVSVTLVGLHVVGVVKDHPEFIWATFEHVDNAPLLPSGVSPTSDDPVSDKDWTFYTKNTPAKDCNVNNAGTPVLDPATQLLHPITQVFLQHENGGGDAPNQANIESLNDSVQSQLAADSVWKKFELGGAIWMSANTFKPGGIPSTDLRGSLTLSNATMETFTQDKSLFQDNCFKCHTSGAQFSPFPNSTASLKPMNMNISHAMTMGYFENVAKEQKKAAAAMKAQIIKKRNSN